MVVTRDVGRPLSDLETKIDPRTDVETGLGDGRGDLYDLKTVRVSSSKYVKGDGPHGSEESSLQERRSFVRDWRSKLI